MREEHFLADSETLIITHVWGTLCNLNCSFCLNEGNSNLNNNIFSLINVFSFKKQLINNSLSIEHKDIDTSKNTFINQMVEIL